MTIREYLIRTAQAITDSATKDYTDRAAFERLQPERRAQFMEMMGLDALPPAASRPKVPCTVTGVVERPGYRIEKLYYESLPNLYVTANLYIPEYGGDARGKFPGVLYVCGHADTQKVHYQEHPRRFAELGFACLIVETVQLGEVRGYHHGCYREGWWNWYSRGYTPGGVELLNGIRGLDLLSQRKEVDADRLGVTGISGGGAVSWYVGAADERIKVCAPVCGTATLASHIADRTIDGHCDCMWWNNIYDWDLADVGSLVAPRPLMIASANRDEIFTIASIRKVHAQLKRVYALSGAEKNLHLVETPGGHSYHERSRTAIFSLFLKHLQGKSVPPEKVGDADLTPARQATEETLRVFAKGALPEEGTATIQDSFIALPKPPTITNAADLEKARRETRDLLRAKTFRHFPKNPPPLNIVKEFESVEGSREGYRFAYTSEEGWRLHATLTANPSVAKPAPAVLVLHSPQEARGDSARFASGLPKGMARIYAELRGVGDTSWGQELQWHIRRASAWTGRTIASMRVWDALRAIEAIRSLPETKGEGVSIAAQGEMCVVALYAALLDGDIKALYLQNPPPTQDAPSAKNGYGEAIETLGSLRIADLPQIAGLLRPAEITLVNTPPETYLWAEKLYQSLGSAAKFRRVSELKESE